MLATHVPSAQNGILTLHKDRLTRLRAVMNDRDVDGVLLTSPESVEYATGHRSLNSQLFPAVALAAFITQNEAIVIVPAGEVGPASRLDETVTDVVTVGPAFLVHSDGNATQGAYSDLPSAVGAVLSGRDLQKVTVEADHDGSVGAKYGSMLVRPGLLPEVRAVKVPGELTLLKRAANISEVAIETAIQAIEPGVSEKDLAQIVARTMVENGGDPRFLVVATGVRAADSDAFPTDLLCREGDLVRFDVGCVYEGYWSDIARTAVIGEPTPKQRDVYQAMLTGVEAELATAQNGVPANDVFNAGIRAAEETGGVVPYRRHHLGHTIGLSIYEQPLITPHDERELQIGMTFCLETPYYERNWGGVIVEETGVVTDAGFELFTSIDRGLRVVS